MISVIVQHEVRDYDTWRPVFDEHASVRKHHGASGHEIYRGLDNPNELTIVNHFASREQGEAFASDPSLPEAMQRGGVIGQPRVTFVGEPEVVEYRQSKAA
jgi:quinol monooxygenase YgiN